MAISNLGATNDLPANQIPSGYTKPVVATFTDFEYQRTITLLVLKATVQNASPAVTMANILNDAAVGINKQIADLVAADFLTTPTVTTFGRLKSLTTNIEVGDFYDQTYLNSTAVSYKCVVTYYVKAV